MLAQRKEISPTWPSIFSPEALDISLSNKVNDFYSKTNQMHNISDLFYFGTTFYMFRTVSPSIIRSLRLYIQHQVYVSCSSISFPLASSHRTLYDIYLMLYVQS